MIFSVVFSGGFAKSKINSTKKNPASRTPKVLGGFAFLPAALVYRWFTSRFFCLLLILLHQVTFTTYDLPDHSFEYFLDFFIFLAPLGHLYDMFGCGSFFGVKMALGLPD